MTGSLRQRGANSWELRVYQGTDPTTGRRRYATRTVRGSRTQAQRELVELAAVANVAPIVGARTTIAELLERWFATSAPNWAPTTVRNTRSIIDRHLAPGLGSVRVRDLTTAAIDDFYSRLRTNGRHDAQPLSTGTVRRVHAVLHRALAQAMRWDWIWANPAAAANKPATEPTEMRPPTPAQINALLAHAAADPAFHLFLVLAATTGARRGELLALRWADIDLAQGSISIQRALVEGPTGPTLAPTKTRRPHHLDLDARTLALLRAHHDQVHGVALGPVGRDRFVFSADPNGAHPWRPNWVTKRFIATRTAAGLGRFRLHDLRHFMATEMLNKHVPLPTVSGRLAHARMSTTLNVYAHAVPSGDRPAATLIADLIGAQPPQAPQPPPSPGRRHPRAHALRPGRCSLRCNRRPST
jgi:integrase